MKTHFELLILGAALMMTSLACSKYAANEPPTTPSLVHETTTEDAGGINGGGGDDCEREFKVIRDDIASWVRQGGAAGLKLAVGTTKDQYSSAMLGELGKARISCVSEGDSGYPVLVGSTPKTCRWDKSTAESRITCDTEKLKATQLAEKYNLIHHEYASLAGLEEPNGDDSNYDISNQISGFLSQEIVKKLAVKNAVKIDDAFVVYEKGYNGDLNKIVYIKDNSARGWSMGWEVVRSWDHYTWLNFSGNPLGSKDTRVCFVRSSDNGLDRHQSYFGIADTDENVKKALIAIVVDDNQKAPANIVCMSNADFAAKYPSDLEKFFEQIDP